MFTESVVTGSRGRYPYRATVSGGSITRRHIAATGRAVGRPAAGERRAAHGAA